MALTVFLLLVSCYLTDVFRCFILRGEEIKEINAHLEFLNQRLNSMNSRSYYDYKKINWAKEGF